MVGRTGGWITYCNARFPIGNRLGRSFVAGFSVLAYVLIGCFEVAGVYAQPPETLRTCW